MKATVETYFLEIPNLLFYHLSVSKVVYVILKENFIFRFKLLMLLTVRRVIYLENVLNTISVDIKKQFLLKYFKYNFLRTSRNLTY